MKMIYKFTPVEMGIYVNAGKKSIDAIHKELNCDILVNLNLFTARTWKGEAYTRSAGKVVGTDGYNYYGFGFDAKDQTLTRGWSSSDKHQNFFGCCDVIKDGKVLSISAPSWTSNLQRRTVIGTAANGEIIIYQNTTKESFSAMKSNVFGAGAVEAVCLDGSGSTQGIFPTGKVVSSDGRVVHTLFWAKVEHPKSVCPYKEPTSNIKNWSMGEGARWVQWYLKELGYKDKSGVDISVDGVFGAKSVYALTQFQRDHGLDPDGICGALTRAALKEALLGDKKQSENVKDAAINSAVKKALDFAYAHLGDLYVYGAQGQDATNSIIDWSARCFPSNTTTVRANRMKLYLKNVKKNPNTGSPLKVFDCSGYVLECLKAAGFDYADTTAAGIYQNLSTPIQKSQLQPGDLVFTVGLDHIGIVGNNGEILAAEGSDIGVVKTSGVDDRVVTSIYGQAYGTSSKYQKSAWQKFSRPKAFQK